MAAKKLANPSIVREDEVSVALANQILVMNEIFDRAKIVSDKAKDAIKDFLTGEISTTMIENEEIVGTFKIPAKDNKIVEVPFSVDTGALSPEELQAVSVLPKDVYDDLFEDQEVSIGISDYDQIVAKVVSLTAPERLKYITVDKGVVVIKLPPCNGLIKEVQTFPVPSLFGRLDQMIRNTTDQKKKELTLKVMEEFLKPRLKSSVKTGNRA